MRLHAFQQIIDTVAMALYAEIDAETGAIAGGDIGIVNANGVGDDAQQRAVVAGPECIPGLKKSERRCWRVCTGESFSL